MGVDVACERDEEWEGEEVGIEEAFAPVLAVGVVCFLNIETHKRGEYLGDEEDAESGEEAFKRLFRCRFLAV